MHADFLFITAEIAAAFAGFASLVAIISTRGGRSYEQEEFDFFTLRNVLFLSLMAIFFALLPNVLPSEAYLLGVANLLYNAGFGFVRLFVSLRPQSTAN